MTYNHVAIVLYLLVAGFAFGCFAKYDEKTGGDCAGSGWFALIGLMSILWPLTFMAVKGWLYVEKTMRKTP